MSVLLISILNLVFVKKAIEIQQYMREVSRPVNIFQRGWGGGKNNSKVRQKFMHGGIKCLAGMVKMFMVSANFCPCMAGATFSDNYREEKSVRAEMRRVTYGKVKRRVILPC